MAKSIIFDPTTATQLNEGVLATPISGLYYLPREASEDERGFYAELTRIPEIDAVLEEPFQIKQLNLSYSETNVMRGIHAENWNKLLTVLEGTAVCAWTDLRQDSDTFGTTVMLQVGRGNEAYFGSMYVSAGIGNSFCVTDGPLYYLYAVDQLYRNRDTSHDVAISLFDPDLKINWPLSPEEAVISDRDRSAISVAETFDRPITS